MTWLCLITLADKSTKIKRLRLSRETIIQLDALIAARRIKIHAHLRARVFIMYGVFGIHFLASTTSSFPMSARSSRWGRNSRVSLTSFAWFSNFRLPKHLRHGAASTLADAFLCLLFPHLMRCFFKKSTFLNICLFTYFSYTLPSSAERRAGDDRENADTTHCDKKVRLLWFYLKFCLAHGVTSPCYIVHSALIFERALCRLFPHPMRSSFWYSALPFLSFSYTLSVKNLPFYLFPLAQSSFFLYLCTRNESTPWGYVFKGG